MGRREKGTVVLQNSEESPGNEMYAGRKRRDETIISQNLTYRIKQHYI